jgi:hypothetical protein
VSIASLGADSVVFSDALGDGERTGKTATAEGRGDRPAQALQTADRVTLIEKGAGRERRLGGRALRRCGRRRFYRLPHGSMVILYDCKRVEFWHRLFCVFIGASISAFYTRKAPSGIPLIKSMFPKLSPEQTARASVVIGLFLGTIASDILYAPQDPMRAIIAGGSSVALLREIAGVKR